MPKYFADLARLPEPWRERWTAAVRAEVYGLLELGVYRVVDANELPAGVRPLPLEFRFQLKRPSGKLKARLIVRGDLQAPLDTPIYAPTATPDALRILLAVAAARNWQLRFADVPQAFLQAEERELMFYRSIPGFALPHGSYLQGLRNSYGSRHAPHQWHVTLRAALRQDLGMESSQFDKTLFIKRVDGEVVGALLIYVDDAALAFDDKYLPGIADWLNQTYSVRWTTEDEYLSSRIKQGSDGSITMSMGRMLRAVEHDHDAEDARARPTPLARGVVVEKTGREGQSHGLRRLLGQLLYVMLNCRPDLAFALQLLSSVAHESDETTYKIARNVLAYTKYTVDYGLRFNAGNDLRLEIYADASFAAGLGPSNRRSVTGIVALIGGAPVAWSSRRQGRTATSSAEAELNALMEASKMAIYLRGLLSELGKVNEEPTTLHCDSAAAISMVSNQLRLTRANRHLGITIGYVADLVAENVVQPVFVRGDEQVADLLTKALGTQQFEFLRSSLLYNLDPGVIDKNKRGSGLHSPALAAPDQQPRGWRGTTAGGIMSEQDVSEQIASTGASPPSRRVRFSSGPTPAPARGGVQNESASRLTGVSPRRSARAGGPGNPI